MRLELPNFYIVKRACKDIKSLGTIHSSYRVSGYAEECLFELKKEDANNFYWLFDWDDPELKLILEMEKQNENKR